MKLAVVGSVDLDGPQYNAARLLIQSILMNFQHRWHPEVTLISGGAEGIDSIAEGIADDLRMPKLIHYPEVRNWEGFKARNILIAEDCDELVMVRSRQSKTYGSGWTADYAEKIGKRVYRYYV